MDAGWIDQHFIDFLMRVAVSLLCGCMVGLERELRGKPTGMRTCVLICLGTALFVRLGVVLSQVDGGKGDASRVLGQVVTGIGFLGGGVIMAHGESIRGVTTATVVWILAATGALIGSGKDKEAIAISIVTVAILVILDHVERVIQRLRGTPPADRG
jgi:putative Mg2+ transporter-C (MgtC) family protein